MKILTHQKNSNFSSSNQQMFDKRRQAVNIRLNRVFLDAVAFVFLGDFYVNILVLGGAE